MQEPTKNPIKPTAQLYEKADEQYDRLSVLADEHVCGHAMVDLGFAAGVAAERARIVAELRARAERFHEARIDTTGFDLHVAANQIEESGDLS